MSKTENFTVRIDENLKKRMKDHPEINWSHVIREHILAVLDDLERMNRLASDSQLTDGDIEELAAMIDAAAAERAQADLESGDPDTEPPRGETDDERSTRPRNVTDVDAT